ncbi:MULTISPECIES: bifunctional GTP diphosphokinase/guanosine-3',5'-bis pyrophosphate 3'-pyrophosphohydrolase [unclassified Photobacterium]|uniref:bifunctional GTP diphosphokinase/guanosine-3',5'-bis pyrophosphate 3'-pyrophosphohydrolase n=1 Tax=unclassified Photobacterium TaxID=2628852 RepID=UPI000D171635|nr:MULTISPECIES: bifunctional GTP diphosphokinase/guanosine-3',5'-bis pyrophosphate 3'-pyrophosphohydrolase [unclassified Photobacterium]PSV25826.1 guanosine-3',5'-bis(diphosphate) 3'-diphosphatase [Photobacterium sp. GB-56]PSV30415.1 guanosine-3',5'-bis(diphosphate) 3'-diphosphatase [Photobacterium sp. GB-72]PSV36431.1 guanosine-3',5'-bis(diphosphate) 3'-diphosphatase [Photobacterium sp. GB-210]PSV36602.1 guanosine-3',5'-bis(diphosphate) 3'-diphosphatase [Photobacterium sp. GB-27]PSV44308.1 g
MYLFDSLKEVAIEYLPEPQLEALRQAFLVARDAHEGQTRSTGEPYIIHPVAVARILAEMRLDIETLMAALLHDVIEDTEVTKEDLASRFGDTVAELVDGVSKLDKLKFRDRKEAQAENFRKMIMAMAHDIRVILIKLADRTHNMRTLGALRPDKRRRIARETLEIFSPLAHRLGIHNIKSELEELGFEALYPNRYRVLKQVVAAARGNRKEMINKIHAEIEGRLSDAGIHATVLGREKNLFSIYNKMKNKEQRFHSIMDIYAFRVLVSDLDTCYRVLGQVHNLYKPRPSRMKDYIAIPKANGYQSLHTSLVGPHGVPVEVQIRTEDMDQMADKGVAAHWTYKDGESSGTTAQVKAQRWMQSLLELQQSAGSSFEFIENVKSDLFPDEIYVFTPKGRIVELPVGATAVDFAYAVHTDVGNACVGSRVDRQPYPLSKPLKNGQTVDIISAPGARPNAAWLNYVVTSRARTKIRQVLKTMRRDESITLGRRLLNHALGGTNIDNIANENITKVLSDLKLSSMDDLLAEIGLGEVMSVVIARRLLGNVDELTPKENDRRLPIQGADGILLTFANCCHPIHGDPIIAHVSPGKGLVIHREECANVRGYRKEPDKYMAVEWSEDFDQEFVTSLKVDMQNHQGALADLTNTIAATGSNIQGLATEEKDGRLYTITVKLTTRSRIHLANIMRRIRIMPNVVRVARQKN